jgi:hypothetical protein
VNKVAASHPLTEPTDQNRAPEPQDGSITECVWKPDSLFHFSTQPRTQQDTKNEFLIKTIDCLLMEDGAEQPATAPESKPEGEKKPKPESEGRSR